MKCPCEESRAALLDIERRHPERFGGIGKVVPQAGRWKALVGAEKKEMASNDLQGKL